MAKYPRQFYEFRLGPTSVIYLTSGRSDTGAKKGQSQNISPPKLLSGGLITVVILVPVLVREQLIHDIILMRNFNVARLLSRRISAGERMLMWRLIGGAVEESISCQTARRHANCAAVRDVTAADAE